MNMLSFWLFHSLIVFGSIIISSEEAEIASLMISSSQYAINGVKSRIIDNIAAKRFFMV